MITRTSRWAAIAAAAMLASNAAGLLAQRNDKNQQDKPSARGANPSSVSFTLPPEGSSLLKIDVQGPSEVRLGDRFNYTIAVTNASDSTMLRDVKVVQAKRKGMTIESSRIAGADTSSSSQGQTQKDQNQQAQDQKEQGQEEQDQQENQQEQDQQGQQQKSGKENPQTGDHEWMIPHLGPQQTARIEVDAAVDSAEQSPMCVGISSYTPQACFPLKVTNPQLELVKTGPDQSGVCAPFSYEYFVKNTGTGDLEAFVVEDQLGDGLRTESGDKQLRFEVDGLAAGQVRKFNAEVFPSRAGEFSSLAVATFAGDKTTRSSEVTTRVTAPRPAVAIDGPETSYTGERLRYTVRVTNQGESAARDALLTLRYPRDLRLGRVGEVEQSQNAVSQSNGQDQDQSSAGQPSPADPQSQQQAQSQQGQQQDRQKQEQDPQQSEMQQLVWRLGDLEPGKTVQVTFDVRSPERDVVPFEAVAGFVCVESDEEALASATDNLKTRIISVPALAVVVVDEQDPVRVGNEVAYTVTVLNEGEVADQDIKLVVSLPDSMEFVRASGQTQGKADGKKVNFEPVGSLEAGQEVQWQVVARPTSGGNARIRAQITSKNITEAVETAEPTTLFDASTASRESSQR